MNAKPKTTRPVQAIDPNLSMDKDAFERAMGRALGIPAPTEPTGKLKSVPNDEVAAVISAQFWRLPA